MIVMVLNNPPPKVKGYVTSLMCEVSPNVFLAAKLNVQVRNRIIEIVWKWYEDSVIGGASLFWTERGEVKMKVVGEPIEVVPVQGLCLMRRRLQNL